jgi:hypothetical protein
MSFIDTLGGIVKGVGGFLQSNSLGSQLAKSALYGFALNKVIKSIQKDQDANSPKDQGTTVTVNPDPNNNVPIIYGSAYTSGILTDAHMAANNTTLWTCLTLSERTGNKIGGTPSVTSFNEVYYNGFRLDFKADGVTVDKAYDDSGNSTDKFSGLIQVYPFNNGSTNPVSFTTESAGNTSSAYNVMPSWSSTDSMTGLIFAIVKINYNAKNRVTRVGDFKFKLTNTMSQPGDVLFDYMTNTRYGAGIPQAEINV